MMICVSISPQSRASLAVKYNMNIDECTRKLCGFLKHYLHVDYVFDTTFSREFSLNECQKEFVKRFKENNKIPVLTSACPGWICYAEKTHGSFILPYISSVKSPQQIMGSLIKDYLCSKLNKQPNNIYHVCIMPCFDKKLESTRKDFYNDLYESKDVDCVLSSNEIEQMLTKENINLNDMPNEYWLHSPFVTDNNNINEFKEIYSHYGGGSGGYAINVLVYAAKMLFNYDLKPDEIVYKQLRNSDFKELILEINGELKLKFALAYGFRNIQNIVQKIKKNNCSYHYVEIMACPSGCLNGGGQIRDTDSNLLTKELFNKVETIYNSLPIKLSSIRDIEQYYIEWLNDGDEDLIKKHLHTKYHQVEKLNNALTIKW